MTLQQAIADMRNNIAILRMVRPPALATENVLAQLVKFVNNVEQAYEELSAAHRRELAEREHVAEEHATEHAEAVARDNCRDCLGRDALVMIKQMGIELRNEIPHLDKKWEACLKMAIRIYQTAEDAYLKAGGVGVALDFGRAGVATVHHYEVRETVAGRCNLVAVFTDPHRAAEYAERIAREGGAA